MLYIGVERRWLKKGSYYVPLDSPVDRLHPMVKIYAIFCLGIGCAVSPFIVQSYAVVAVLFITAAKAKILSQFSKFIIGFAIPITVMLMFIQGLYSPNNHTFIADLGFAKLGLEGVLYTLKIVGALLVFLGSFFIMSVTTYPGKLVAALVDVGMSAKAGYLVLASLNVVPQIQRRMSITMEAQTARGVEVEGKLSTRMFSFVPLIGPVVMSSLVDVQERGMTLETRGFGIKGVKNTSYVKLENSNTDKLIKGILVAFLLFSIAAFIISKFI